MNFEKRRSFNHIVPVDYLKIKLNFNNTQILLKIILLKNQINVILTYFTSLY